ncbi:class I SAM-dependent methyltransferase [Nocardioides sp. URHA0032]|uniref:methyltransferase domain-containing protein n=1 Tax=Nocardioides sp. URHA0032 TaxID=1380388 RepID=UPI000686B14B|nr:class I SAM-dependent methyltransferase [Nocardioides sp. URHA0032]
MSEDRTTHADLDWWLEFAASREWMFAKTYAETAPHHYIVEGRTSGVTHEHVVRAARVIHTFGQPGRYYSLTKIYLVSPDGEYRWWTEDNHFTDTTLVNRATTELFYGVQNAPSTASGVWSEFDGVATTWDADHPAYDGEAEVHSVMLNKVRGTYPPHVLDLGCGTGRVLDLGLATPDRYAGADSSQAMLNMLVRKHAKVAAIYPMNVTDLLETGTFTDGQFDWVFLDSAVQLTDAQRAQVERIARLAVIEVRDQVWALKDVREATAQRLVAAGSGRREAS